MADSSTPCGACVYHPPNLPRAAYSAADWEVLTRLSCAYEYEPDDANCQEVRKSSCSVVNLSAAAGGG